MYNDPDGHAFKFLSRLAKSVKKVFSSAKRTVKRITKRIVRTAASITKKAKRTIKNVVKKAKYAVRSVVKTTSKIIRSSWNSFKNKTVKSYNRVVDKVQEIKNTSAKVFENVKKKVEPFGNYISKSVKQVVFGNFTDDVTLLGSGMQMALGVVGVDIVTDIRDVAADIVNWEWSKEHALQTGLDIIGLVPAIGAIKSLKHLKQVEKFDYVLDLSKEVKRTAKVAKNSDEVAQAILKSFKNGDEIYVAMNKTRKIVYGTVDTLDDVEFKNLNKIKVQRAVDFDKNALEALNDTGIDIKGYTITSRELGQKIHKGYKKSSDGLKEIGYKNIRPDFWSRSKAFLFELKPLNPKNIRKGILQLEKYNKTLGGGYDMTLELYQKFQR